MIEFYLTLLIAFLTGFTPGSSSEKNPGTDLNFSFTYKGVVRNALIHLPPGREAREKYPLLIALHGGGGNGKRMVSLTQGKFNILADKEGFIVVYPDGIGKNWNDGRENMPRRYQSHNNKTDDVGFISALIDSLVRKYNADQNRVYVTGMSNGAMMTYRLATELGEKIAAAAPVCGSIPADLPSKPGHPVAMLIINGTDDPLVPFEGGDVHFGRRKLGKILSTSKSVEIWTKINQVHLSEEKLLPDKDPMDGCRVKETKYTGSDNSSEVIVLTIQGGGHTWPGGKQYLTERIIGRTCRDIDACECIWSFFKRIN
ncbi:MAG: prolyl oligopeptidase family serine peptidase [Bacteroidales bacterium]|nr:prolyl oligopeptidase family serine peptidase [Bacteroidales bacterium]